MQVPKWTKLDTQSVQRLTDDCAPEMTDINDPKHIERRDDAFGHAMKSGAAATGLATAACAAFHVIGSKYIPAYAAMNFRLKLLLGVSVVAASFTIVTEERLMEKGREHADADHARREAADAALRAAKGGQLR